MTTEEQEYENTVEDLIVEFNKMISNGTEVDIKNVVEHLDIKFNNRKARKWASTLARICTEKQFDMELAKYANRQKVIDALGVYPQTASQLVDAYLKKNGVAAKYNGIIEKRGEEFMLMADGTRQRITEEDKKVREIFLYNQIMNDPEQPMHELAQEIRLTRDNLRLDNFADSKINDALSVWLRNAKKERLMAITNVVFTDIKRIDEVERIDAVWLEVARRMFDCNHEEETPQFVVAVLKNFMYQVKRKIANLKVNNHLMPIILGPQGVGKTRFIELFLEPVDELVMEMDFGLLNEDKVFGMYEAFVWKFDEMGGIDKIEADKLKQKLTQERTTGRPMRTNDASVMRQRATAIGASNKVVSQMIKDSTGLRRFVELRFRNYADKAMRDASHAFINSVNFEELWCSVDEQGVDPMEPHREALKEQQEGNTVLSTTEQWLESMVGKELDKLRKSDNPLRIDAKKLFKTFQDFEDQLGNVGRISYQSWRSEMKRLSTNGKSPFHENKRGSDGHKYSIT